MLTVVLRPAISTPSTVPVTVTLPVTVNAPVAALPDVDKFCDPNEGVTFVPAIAALAFMSSFTIVPSTMFALATVTSVGNAPAASESVAIVSVANLAAGIVPLDKSAASKLVKLAPLIAGNVAGNLASGIVPLVKLLPFKAVKSIAAQDVLPFASVVKKLPLTILLGRVKV